MIEETIRRNMGTATCVGAGCVRGEAAGRPRRPAVAGSRLCPPCHRHLLLELMRLPGLYEECGLRLGGESGPCREKTSGGPLPGMPFNSRAADARTSILGVLASWASMVVEERGLAGPRRSVAPLAQFLARHGDWLAAHSAAGEVSGEVARLVRKARGVIDPVPSRHVVIGGCVEPGCPGALTAVVRPRRPQVPAEITCDADDSHSWFGHEWLQLSRRVGAARSLSAGSSATGSSSAGSLSAASPGAGSAEQDRATGAETPQPGPADAGQEVRWVTAADIASLWGIPVGSVYRHASTRKWRRRNRSGRTFYHGVDVYETLDRVVTAANAR
ncbi:hypothetical protein [Streptomyces sp. NPDC058812]|uniref:hypothetical protein n=1 Tax=unclassified Streptomyces TaxID=2593676 RepID=UPI0036C4BCDC